MENTKTLILSYMTEDKEFHIEHPKWWQLWEKAKLVEKQIWTRKIFQFSNTEKTALKMFNSELFKEYLKATNKGVFALKLEHGTEPSKYIKTDGDDFSDIVEARSQAIERANSIRNEQL